MKSVFKKLGALASGVLSNVTKDDNGKFSKVKIGLLLLSFFAYALLLSWKFALLAMFAIGFHESGHIWAMNKVGVKTRGFYFVPFMGCVAIATSEAKTMADKVIISIMGPVWGMLLALATWIAYVITGEPILGVATFWQALVNLFNLLPASPLDGGQIFRAILSSFSKKVSDCFSFISVLALAVLFYKTRAVIFMILTFVSAQDFWMYYKNGLENEATKMSKGEIIISSGIYAVLALILLIIVGCTSAGDLKLLTR